MRPDLNSSPDPDWPSGKAILPYIGKVVCSIVVGFLIMEIAVRAFFHPIRFYEATYIPVEYDPLLVYRPRPGWSGLMENLDYSVRVTIGPDGLRHHKSKISSDTAPRRPEALRRTALFFGDSFMFGDGLEDDQTIPAQVEDELAARGRPIRCRNAGLPGWTLAQGYFYHATHLKDIQAETVVILLCTENALMDESTFLKDRFRWEKDTPEALIRPVWTGKDAEPLRPVTSPGLMKRLLRKSRLYVVTASAVHARFPRIARMLRPEPRQGLVDVRIRQMDRQMRLSMPYSETDPDWKTPERILAAWNRMTKERGGRLVLAVIPSAWMLDKKQFDRIAIHWPKGAYSPTAARDGLKSIAEREGIGFVDLTPHLKSNLYYAFDGHLMPEGARRAARVVVQGAF